MANELMIAIHNGIFEDKKMLNQMWQKAREMVPDAEAPAGAEGGEDEMEEMVEDAAAAEGGEDEQVEGVHEGGEDEIVEEEEDVGI